MVSSQKNVGNFSVMVLRGDMCPLSGTFYRLEGDLTGDTLDYRDEGNILGMTAKKKQNLTA